MLGGVEEDVGKISGILRSLYPVPWVLVHGPNNRAPVSTGNTEHAIVIQ